LVAVAVFGAVVAHNHGPTLVDRWGLSLTRHIPTVFWRRVAKMSSVFVLVPATLLCAALALRRSWRLVIACLVAPVVTVLVAEGAKHVFGRLYTGVLSYPSGSVAAVTSVVGIYLLVAPRKYRAALATAASLIVLLMAGAVVNLRWHYPTDAIAGSMVGIAVILVMDYAMQRVPTFVLRLSSPAPEVSSSRTASTPTSEVFAHERGGADAADEVFSTDESGGLVAGMSEEMWVPERVAVEPLQEAPRAESLERPSMEETVEPVPEMPPVEPSLQTPRVEPSLQVPLAAPVPEMPQVEPVPELPPFEPALLVFLAEPVLQTPPAQPVSETPEWTEPVLQMPQVEPVVETPQSTELAHAVLPAPAAEDLTSSPVAEAPVGATAATDEIERLFFGAQHWIEDAISRAQQEAAELVHEARLTSAAIVAAARSSAAEIVAAARWTATEIVAAAHVNASEVVAENVARPEERGAPTRLVLPIDPADLKELEDSIESFSSANTAILQDLLANRHPA